LFCKGSLDQLAHLPARSNPGQTLSMAPPLR
jgi:hypothetical protein